MDIVPERQTVEKCLSKRKYDIDFYQREYVWEKETVQILLNDIFYQFDLSYEAHKDSDISEKVLSRYNWYYLNIYITNNIDGKEYVVDGQQRLTTLCLISMKLFHLASSKEKGFQNVRGALKDCIYGTDLLSGDTFWIDHKKRKSVMQFLMNHKDTEEDFQTVTEKNIKARYGEISKYFDEKKMNDKKLEIFIIYFLKKLVLVELKIKKDDTPMIFEVINDRGLALRPFEILKGKLLGSLAKADIEEYNSTWEESISKLQKNEDNFFTDYLKAEFIFTRKADVENQINQEYHRYIFKPSNEIANRLKFRKKDHSHIQKIKDFITNDFRYYASLYSKIRENQFEYLFYNNEINDLSGQYQNIMAACNINDAEKLKELKIKTISKEIDRLFIILQLNGIYDSNNFQTISYGLNESLRDKDVGEYRDVFDAAIKDRIRGKFNVKTIRSLLEYKNFKMRRSDNINSRVLKYLLARVEKYICDNVIDVIDVDEKRIWELTRSGTKTGYHIEHILSNNDKNKSYFDSEEEFSEERNRLGGLLLLQGKKNVSSGNEGYEDKLRTYSNGLEWGKTLRDDYYHRNVDFIRWNDQLKKKHGISFEHVKEFNKEALEKRSKLLHVIVKMIWEIE